MSPESEARQAKRAISRRTMLKGSASILSAGLFGFTLSLNEFERSVLVTSDNTLPLQLWAMLTVSIIEPDLYALGTLTTLITFAIVGALFIPTLIGQFRRITTHHGE